LEKYFEKIDIGSTSEKAVVVKKIYKNIEYLPPHYLKE